MNNLPTRTGLQDDHTAAVNTLLFSYDSKEPDDIKRGRIGVYKSAVSELPQWTTEQAVQNFLTGKVERKNSDFRPSPEAFAKEARRVLDEEIERQEVEARRRKLKAIDAPRRSTGTAPFETGQNRARMTVEGRSVLAKGIGHTEFKTRARTKEWPDGSQWLAATGEVYGPEKRKAE